MRLPLAGSFEYRLKAGASEPTTSLNSWLAAALSMSVKSNTWPGCRYLAGTKFFTNRMGSVILSVYEPRVTAPTWVLRKASSQ